MNNNSGEAVTDGKIYSETNLVKITAKPSCGCRHSYCWHIREFENYCPKCHRYDCLGNKHKYGAKYEQEVTCLVCDADFCGVCGKEKYSWSHSYLNPKDSKVTYVGETNVIK